MNVRKLRERLTLSQAGLAALVGAHAMTVSKWERGVAKPAEPQVRTLRALARAAEQGWKAEDAAVRRDPARALANAFDSAYSKPELDLGALSASNRFPGRIVELRRGDIVSKLVIEIAPLVRMGSVITTDSVDRLGLAVGGHAIAIVKATEVIVGRA
ncbi:MAG: helix-turn-helix domain-containing protein [Planctomycetes bacterium]|nr:helix-turn-helix domain-containing protein [Planctomycetota bacterium]